MVSPDYKSEIFARLVLGPGSSPAVIIIVCPSKASLIFRQLIILL